MDFIIEFNYLLILVNKLNYLHYKKTWN